MTKAPVVVRSLQSQVAEITGPSVGVPWDFIFSQFTFADEDAADLTISARLRENRTNVLPGVADTGNPTGAITYGTKGGAATATLTLVNDLTALNATGDADLMAKTGGQVWLLDNSAGVTDAYFVWSAPTPPVDLNVNWTLVVDARADAAGGEISFQGGTRGKTLISGATYKHYSVSNTGSLNALGCWAIVAYPGARIWFVCPGQFQRPNDHDTRITITGTPTLVGAPLPPWIVIDPKFGLRGSPGRLNAGQTYGIEIKATEPGGDSNTHIVNLNVAALAAVPGLSQFTIPSTLRFGTAAVLTTGQLGMVAKGIVPTTRFGSHAIGGFAQVITGVGITSKIVYGIPTLTNIGWVIQPPAFINPNLFGTAVIDIGEAGIVPTGITSKLKFGSTVVRGGTYIPPSQHEDAQKLIADAYIDLFEITLASGNKLFLKPNNDVSWQGNNYEGCAIKIDSVGRSADEERNRPNLYIMNPAGVFSPLIRDGEVDNALVTRIRVLKRDLEADNNVAYRQSWRISRIASLRKEAIQLELRDQLDAQFFLAPGRMFIPPEFPQVSLQ